MNKKVFAYVRDTLKFSVAGLFIPGLTVFIFLGPQMSLTYLGVECGHSWTIVWLITSVGAMANPILFCRLIIKRLRQGFHVSQKQLMIFNLLEYTLIQCTLGYFFTTGKTLRYVSDGQIGLEFVFTGWIAIPFLILLSLFFEFVNNKPLEDIVVK